MFDPTKARENIEAVFAGQTEAGNFPYLITVNDAWLDRSQPPIATYVLWSLFERTCDTQFLEWAYPHFVKALAPTAFFPLLAGIATQDQAQALVKNYLTPEEKFGGRFSLPAASRDEPAFQHNTYWRGRVWGQLNYWVYQGFRRYGMFERRKIWPGKVRRCSPLSGNTDIVVKTTMRRQVKSPISRTPTAFIHGARFCRC